MSVLILKLGATGDVVRTTTLLRIFPGNVTWITAQKNVSLLQGLRENLRYLSWEERNQARDRKYDLIVNLEDDEPSSRFIAELEFQELYGAYLNAAGELSYTEDSRRWFDLSLISVYGRKRADELKLKNRETYQELIFAGLGHRFKGEPYHLPSTSPTDLTGDVALAADSGPVWPMKKWAHYEGLKAELESEGLVVNILPKRNSLLEHLADVRNHRFLVGGDSLPMHFALGSEIPCVSIFTCTSPWEIHDYGIQTKLISPLLDQYFYQRGFDERATTAITLGEVKETVLGRLAKADATVPVIFR